MAKKHNLVSGPSGMGSASDKRLPAQTLLRVHITVQRWRGIPESFTFCYFGKCCNDASLL